jgi:hypothetical protein
LTTPELSALTGTWSNLDGSEQIHIDTGQVLIAEGAEADSGYMLLAGSLEVSRSVARGRDQRAREHSDRHGQDGHHHHQLEQREPSTRGAEAVFVPRRSATRDRVHRGGLAAQADAAEARHG